MPRYDYRCEDDACETDTFEVSKSYSDTSPTLCPGCESEAKKLLSPIAVHFKGSGFYVTDNRASNGASGSSSDSSESKSESKSEEKSEKKSGSDSKSKTETKSKAPSSPGSSSGGSKSASKVASSSN